MGIYQWIYIIRLIAQYTSHLVQPPRTQFLSRWFVGRWLWCLFLASRVSFPECKHRNLFGWELIHPSSHAGPNSPNCFMLTGVNQMRLEWFSDASMTSPPSSGSQQYYAALSSCIWFNEFPPAVMTLLPYALTASSYGYALTLTLTLTRSAAKL